MLSFEDARRKVIEATAGLRRIPASEAVKLENALGRILAERIVADRDYPPFDRATRDGFAVRAADCREADAKLRVIGEIRAGGKFVGAVNAGECVQIMTGAAMPPGTDAVVMIEHTRASAKQNEVVIERAAEAGINIVPRGAESRAGDPLLGVATRMGYAEIAVAAQVGRAELRVYRKPRVAILSTGDEVVAADATPGPLEIRNSNGASLAAQAKLAGAEPVLLGNAPDRAEELRKMIARGLEEDALVLSGGVSMGKYDLVEEVLRGLGAELFFDAVAIRPGRPAVFGMCRGRPVFGLPGNPVSTMVTFELFVVPAIDILGGGDARPLPLLKAKLARAAEQKAALTHFLPATLEWPNGEATVTELPWQGSGDIATLACGNCFLVVHQSKLKMDAGEWVDVLPRRGLL
ncbi:MAG TPA: gephyrin-like molybdotransferase Glp [Candidatus Limnocylindrales bacterium]|nr:gephyrin-like molybdotransferase Glp [Candidatus Limnocylindrales bacterium]